ncbi:hypothetical protein ATANTOWER_029888 [Ataeniobius toweri]|uniref:Uncharacterized protein n=1 Tax=Ataeniobius toweri TaxID=208326 RepID=A0ABU7CMG2_9TELE|nr:hypothetical protein [Ataeniobius toweri]
MQLFFPSLESNVFCNQGPPKDNKKSTMDRWFSERILGCLNLTVTSHLNELNLRLQGKDNSVSELITAVRSFQRKLEVFKEDLQGECAHFPALQEQLQLWATAQLVHSEPSSQMSRSSRRKWHSSLNG